MKPADAAPKSALKPVNARSLYNMMQDDQHLAIIDIRPKELFMANFIRRSYNYDPLSDDLVQSEMLIKFIQKLDENAKINEEKYKLTAKTRRVAIIIDSSQQKAQEARSALEASNLLDSFDFKFVLLDHFPKFVEKYPFLTISIPDDWRSLPFDQIQAKLLETRQADILFANASFPFEVLEDSVFVGRHIHADNKKILEKLQISVVIEVLKKDKGLAMLLPVDGKDGHYVIELDMETMLDFDSILNSIFEVTEGKRVLFMGTTIEMPAGMVIGYIMKKTKQQLNFASMRVFSAVGGTIVDRILYNHLMNYEPGKIVFIKV